MGLSDCPCGGHIPLGPRASNCCDRCGETTHPPRTDEADPTGRAPGAKLDAGKAPLMRGALHYFPRALTAVAEVSAHGASKYSWRGWESVPDGIDRYGDALARHLAKDAIEDTDADSGLLHAAHAAWNALARLELILREMQDQ